MNIITLLDVVLAALELVCLVLTAVCFHCTTPLPAFVYIASVPAAVKDMQLNVCGRTVCVCVT